MNKPRRVVPVPSSSEFAGFGFPPEVIVLAVRWYLRFGLSYRHVEELLADRGIEVDHVTIYRWVRRFRLSRRRGMSAMIPMRRFRLLSLFDLPRRGLLVAVQRDYFAHATNLWGFLSLIVAVLLWPLVLLGVHMAIQGSSRSFRRTYAHSR